MAYPGMDASSRRASHGQTGRSQQYRVGPMMTATSVDWALSNTALTRDPEYVKAVIRSYIQAKAANGRPKAEIGFKLEYLEVDYPQFTPNFLAIRQEYGLPPSRVIRQSQRPPPPQQLSNTTTSPLRRAQTSTSSASPTLNRLYSSTPTINRTRTTTGATTNRPANSDDTEPPPPPYTTQDPEPEATRMLQERLAAEAEAAGTVATDNIQQSTSVPNRTPSVTSPRPASVRNTTSNAQASSIPSTPVHTATPLRTSLEQRPPSPPPSDPEMARVWEESQLSEAKRASLAWQREEEELREAMRLSLAISETQGESSTSAQAGPSGRQMSAVAEEDEPSSSRRVSSYHPLAQAQVNPHRRVASDATGSLTNEQPIPGGWQANSRPNSSIMDHEEEGQNFTQTPLAPNKTGHALQSNNPFLSPAEREHLQVEEEHIQSPPLARQHSAMDDLVDLQLGEMSSIQQDQGSQRSSSIQQHPVGSLSSTKTQYAPPSGPPPPHLRVYTPPSSNSAGRPLPRPPPEVQGTNLLPPLLPPRPTQSGKVNLQQDGGEDPLETLRDFDTVFLVDDSTSMAGERWSQARSAIMEVAEIAARYDEDGVDIYFINSKRVGKELRSASDVEDVFMGLEPKGATPTGLRLEAILRDYMARLERSVVASPGLNEGPGEHVKPMNLIVVTDGAFARPVIARLHALAADPSLERNSLLAAAPTDDPESVLIACAKRLDKGDFPLSQVGIQFLQIGDDVEAREALEELDDGLSAAHGVRDMVDTVPYRGEDITARMIIKTLLGGVNRRLDRRGG